MKLPISEIRTDGGTQPRAQLDGVTVSEYAEAMERGDDFPPVKVMHDGDNYWLYDGFHRVKAAQKIDRTEIEADVEQGTQEDAQWASLAANKKHGLRRSQADKRRAIKRALKKFGDEKSNNEIAQHIGCSDTTVGKYEKELESTSQFGKSDKRTGADGRTIDTSKIGGSSSGTQPSTGDGSPSSTSGIDSPSESEEEPYEVISGHLNAGGELYCKYCYETHSQWRMGSEPDLWDCELCGHTMSGRAHRSYVAEGDPSPDPDTSNPSNPPRSDDGQKPMTTGAPDRRRRRDLRERDSDYEPIKVEGEEEDELPSTEDVTRRVVKALAKIRESEGAQLLLDFADEQHQFTSEQRKEVQETAENLIDFLQQATDSIKP